VNRSRASSASAISQALRQRSIHSSEVPYNLQDSRQRALPPLLRPRFLRFHAVLPAVLTSPFLLSMLLSLTFLSLILTLNPAS